MQITEILNPGWELLTRLPRIASNRVHVNEGLMWYNARGTSKKTDSMIKKISYTFNIFPKPGRWRLLTK